jgi:hypothetical protein
MVLAVMGVISLAQNGWLSAATCCNQTKCPSLEQPNEKFAYQSKPTIVNPNMKMAKMMRKRQASTIRFP